MRTAQINSKTNRSKKLQISWFLICHNLVYFFRGRAHDAQISYLCGNSQSKTIRFDDRQSLFFVINAALVITAVAVMRLC